MTGLAYDAVNHFHQPKNGYRFSVDSIHLARFVDLKGVKTAADFGAGCGVVGFSALEIHQPVELESLFFIEKQADLLNSLRLNLDLYARRTTVRLDLVEADWRNLKPADFGGFLDYIMVNPPYFPLAGSRPSSNPGKDQARREVHGGLEELWAALSGLVRPGGKAALVLPLGRRDELQSLMKTHGFTLAREKLIADVERFASPRLVLSEALKL